ARAADARSAGRDGLLDRSLSASVLRPHPRSLGDDRSRGRRTHRDGAGAGLSRRPACRGESRCGGRRRRPLKVDPSDWVLLAPELFLTAGGLLLLALSVFVGKAKEEFLGFLSILLVAITGVLLAIVAVAAPRDRGPILGGMFVLDNFALFFQIASLFSIPLTSLASIRYVCAAPSPAGRVY